MFLSHVDDTIIAGVFAVNHQKKVSYMSAKMGSQKYYRTNEMCHLANISRSTFLRWIKDGMIKDAERRDRRGWRLFTQDEVNRIIIEASRFEKD